MNNQTNVDDNSSSSSGGHFVSQLQRDITMPVLIAFAIPSIICFSFIFYHFIKLRKRLIFSTINHHVILLILICDFLLISTELPISLSYLALGHAPTPKICTFWIYWDYILETASLFLTMYAAIERYILVFLGHYIKNHKFMLHYIPMACAGLYIPIIYFYFIILAPCIKYQTYDITSFTCGGTCFFSIVYVNTYDTIVDTLIPCLTLLIFNLLIILRVLISRRRASSSASLMEILRKNRRMLLQLLGISLMSLTAWMPWVVIIIAQNFFDPSFGSRFITYILHYLPYLTASLSPFFALIGMPEIRRHLTIGKYQTNTTSKQTDSTAVKAIVSASVRNTKT